MVVGEVLRGPAEDGFARCCERERDDAHRTRRASRYYGCVHDATSWGFLVCLFGASGVGNTAGRKWPERAMSSREELGGDPREGGAARRRVMPQLVSRGAHVRHTYSTTTRPLPAQTQYVPVRTLTAYSLQDFASSPAIYGVFLPSCSTHITAVQPLTWSPIRPNLEDRDGALLRMFVAARH